MKVELVNREEYPTRAYAKKHVARYIELFYNCRRRHSALGYVSPVAFEAAASKGEEAA